VPELSRSLRIIGLAAVLGATGCDLPAELPSPPPPAIASGLYPPWTLNQSPERISLRWYPDVTPTLAAQQIAKEHCASSNKVAVLVSDTRDGSAEIAEFLCR
jgi:(2Fe-2S) ferredoxin